MKNLKFFAIVLISMFAISNEVKASTIVDCITGTENNTCVLSEDVVVTETLKVQSEIVLDLNGHTIKSDDNVTITGGIVGVSRGGKLTIKDSVGSGKITSGSNTNVYGAIQVTVPGDSNVGALATLVVESGTFEGYYYAIVGNGSRHNTSITINGGTFSTVSPGGTAIYHPEEGTLTINGGTITGGTGIEMRSGVLTVNGGTIIGTDVPTSVTPNGNGTTTSGAGIAIAQHTTKKDISVKIKGGTIKGYSAIYESNPQHNPEVQNQVNVSITGGSFEAINDGTAVIYSEDLQNFIVRGTFNKEVDSSYISDKVESKLVNGEYVIGLGNGNTFDEDSNYDLPTTYDSEIYIAPMETYDVDLSWDDLHWVFVYEGDITNPSKKVWLTKVAYEEIKANSQQTVLNELNGEILNSISSLETPEVDVIVENNSTFAVDVAATVENINGEEDYTNAAGLQVAVENGTYASSASIQALATNTNAKLQVKPTATRFVNNTGATANVSGEVKITFAKSN